MKNKLFTTLAIFGLSFIAWNCSGDPASVPGHTSELPGTQPKAAFDVDQHCFMVNTGTAIYFIIPNGTGTYTVTNEYSVPVGTFDVATSSIIIDGAAPIVVDLSSLPVVNPGRTITYPNGYVMTPEGEIVSAPGEGTPNSSAVIAVSSSSVYTPGIPVASSSSAKVNPVVSSSSQKTEQPKPESSSAKQEQPGNGGTGSLTQTVAQGKAITPVTVSGVNSQPTRQSWNAWFIQDSDCKYDASAKTFTISATVPGGFQVGEVTETWTADGKSITLTLNVTSGNGSQETKSSSSQKQDQPKSSSSQVKSSSSKAKSSSSQAKSSSSKAKSSSSQAKSSSSTIDNPNASAEEAKYLNAGAGGQQGFATRYWDCCMPHCSWPEHGGAAKTCDAKGKTPIGNTNGSICSGGQGTTCTSQIPIIVSDKLAYAFAATPGNDATCGKCFALTFTGTGKYETKANHKALAGKTLVVMASNIGYDVQGGQFDVMIPGGGFGAFNGCSQMGWNIPQNTTTYGGLLSDCEKEVGYSGDLLTKRKECLTEKCNRAFASDTQAKEGCLFLATWMEAAGNPNHTYKEVECPAALKAQF